MLNKLRNEVYEDAVKHGLWDDSTKMNMETCYVAARRIADEVEELKESAFEIRSDPNHFKEELADVIIMCLSVAGRLNIDIESAVRDKIEKNKLRSYKHEND